VHKLFEKIQKQIEDFIEQRDDFIMLVPSSENDAPLVLKALQDIEQATATDVFLLFTDNFIELAPFVSVTIERLKTEHQMACQYLAEKGRDPLSPVPQTLFDESRPPIDRLIEAISFARSLVPREGGHRLVWAMFPLKITDRRAYLELVSSLVPWKSIKPWMAGVRLIFRDEVDSESYNSTLAKGPRVRLAKVDYGPNTIEESLKEEVEDEELPDAQRMQSLLALACQDYAYNRTDDAIAKFNLLLGYYQKTENHTMQAFVINAFGDIYHRSGDLEKAHHWYECAVPPSVESKSPVIMATIGRNLGEISYKKQKYQEAEQYFDGVEKLASHMLDPESKASALEWRGLSQEKQGAYDRAIESWETAALLCRNTDLPTFLKMNLEHLERVYSQLRMREKLMLVQDELKNLKQKGGSS
jgi:tetratricopeptide (TPR) repeat protein